MRLVAVALSVLLLGLPGRGEAAVMYEVVGREGRSFTFRWSAPDFQTFPNVYSYEPLAGVTACIFQGGACPSPVFASSNDINETFFGPLFPEEIRITVQEDLTGWGGAFTRQNFLTLGTHAEIYGRNVTLSVAAAPASVPEPAGLAVLTAGLLALGAIRLRGAGTGAVRGTAARRVTGFGGGG